MKMYVWASKFFADYTDGQIVVMGTGIVDARKAAMNHFLVVQKRNKEELAELKKELAVKPKVLGDGVFIAWGSA